MATPKKKIEIHRPVLVRIADLKPHPRNYRKHEKDQVEHVGKSFEESGVYKNVVIARDGTLLAGHGVVETAKAKGLEEVYAVKLPYGPTDARALKVLTGDNEVGHLAIVDDRLLTDLLKEVHISNEGLFGTGFDELSLANLVFVTRPDSEIADFNAAREWVGLPAYDEEDPTRNHELVLVITFKKASDRERFVKEKQIRIKDTRGGRKWSTVYPFEEKHDLKSVKFEARKKARA